MKPMLEKPGCYPVQVVNVNTKAIEINWRCAGAVPPTNENLNRQCTAAFKTYMY